MRKLSLLLVLMLFSAAQLLAQRTITGTVTGDDGKTLPGATVVVNGDNKQAAQTDLDGKYSIKVPANGKFLRFSFVGMKSQDVNIGASNVINVALSSEASQLEGVVVTALGISREQKTLGYAVQGVSGDKLNATRESNVGNAISGKVAGVQIKQASTMGGSTNIVIRGNKSFTGSNQAMFVVDGVPIDNSVSNSIYVAGGHGGYDYGNAASDINPDDIESMSVLKGAAASALYGSRAANGVILITTKKGSTKKGIGVTVNSGVLFTKVDKSTLPKIQKEYGAGYGPADDPLENGYDPTGYFLYKDLDGDGKEDLIVPIMDDASWGAKFNPNTMVFDWKALTPTLKDFYLKKTPWVAAQHDIRDFFETGVKFTNNVALDGVTDKSTYRLSYTNNHETGIVPNSKMIKNVINFVGSYNFTKNFSVESNVSYIKDDNKGRYGTGYDPGNPMQSLAQWFQTNVDIKELKEHYIDPNGKQITWNYANPTSLRPIYHNNIYWTRNVNYENDGRDRVFGYITPKYKILPWLTLEARAAIDSYNENQEERVAIGSNQTAQYSQFLRRFVETNFDLMLKFNKNLSSDISLSGLLGGNRRRTKNVSTYATTEGGLLVPNLYTLGNSVSPIITRERDEERGSNSGFGSLSVGYKGMWYVDLTGRIDKSSTLPKDNNTYFYPSVSTSFILSELPFLKSMKFLSFAKIRLNYAEVGNDAPAYVLQSTYVKSINWENTAMFRLPRDIANNELKPERTKSWEVGFESKFLDNRVGLDFAYYKTNSVDQIMSVNISRASGYNERWVNSGEIENKGIEFALNATPVKFNDFTWDLQLNWFKNTSKVLSLYEGVSNIVLSSAWDVSTNISVGEPYGVLKGKDFVYTNGKRTVNAKGAYLYAKDKNGAVISDAVLGSPLPDWNAGFSNTFSYKGISLYALIDISKGGSIYSVDYKYGVATGLFEETAGLNDKGKPKRDPVKDGGGIKLDGVFEDGTPNNIYVYAGQWGSKAWYYGALPTAYNVFDASYVKLRELSLSYAIPAKLIKKTPFTKINFSLVGRNLWIIHKNTPFFDPETNQSSGNIQGISNGAYPSTRTYGFNLSFSF